MVNKRALLKAITCLAILLMYASPSLASDLFELITGGGTVEQVRQALEDGADVNARDADGFTPLMLAVGARPRTEPNDKIARLLIRHGADVNAVAFGGNTAILLAMRAGASVETLNFLIDSGADTSAVNDIGETIWHSYALSYFFYTLRYGVDVPPEKITNEDIFEILKASGVSVNQVDDYGVTPLMIAAYVGTREAVRLLIEAGADAALECIEGSIAYFHAIRGRRLDNAELIFFNGDLFQFYLARALYVLFWLALIIEGYLFAIDIKEHSGGSKVTSLSSWMTLVFFLFYPLYFWWHGDIFPPHLILSRTSLTVMGFRLFHFFRFFVRKWDKEVLPNNAAYIAWRSLAMAAIPALVYLWTNKQIT